MEDHITIWKKQREPLSSGLLQSHAMLYSIGNQLLCPGEQKILLRGVSKDSTPPKEDRIQRGRMQGRLKIHPHDMFSYDTIVVACL